MVIHNNKQSVFCSMEQSNVSKVAQLQVPHHHDEPYDQPQLIVD